MPETSALHARLIVLIGGVLGAFASSATGESAEHLVHPTRSIVEMHSFFAATSTWIYGLLLVGEVLRLAHTWLVSNYSQYSLVKVLLCIERILSYPLVVGVLVVLGIVAISVTGLLGGVLVYGTTADPLAPVVLKLLGLVY